MPKLSEVVFDHFSVKALKPKEKKYFIHGGKEDDNDVKHGFAICIYPSGTKSWFFIYRFEGKKCFMPLGQFPIVSLAQARAKFEEQWNIFASGKNPATAEEEKQAAEKARQDTEKAAQDALDAQPTVKQLIAAYLEQHAMVNKKNWDEDKRILEKDLLGINRPRDTGQRDDRKGAEDWSKRKARDITKTDIKDLNAKIKSISPHMANNTFKVVRKMFNWAVGEDLLKISPCIGVPMPLKSKSKSKSKKGRKLSEAEVKSFWTALDGTYPDVKMSDEVKAALRLILVTAQRPGEIAGMHTKEIDGSWWTIPAERAKNGQAHRVYLSTLAREIISQTITEVKEAKERAVIRRTKAADRGALKKEDTEYSGFIFPCPLGAREKPITRHALSKALKKNESEDGSTLGIEKFTPHDLRRTAATLMAGCKIIYEYRERVLNHSPKELDDIYNLYDYDDEKQLALETLERKLQSIISGKEGKVIPINRASGEN
jgi:integrase